MPTEPSVQKAWIVKIMRDKSKTFSPGKNSYVCSAHFKKEDINKSLTGIRRLKVGASPSVFAWAKPSNSRRVIVKNNVESKGEGIVETTNADKDFKDVGVHAVLDLVTPVFTTTFSVSQIEGNDRMVNFYTSTPSYKIFKAFYDFLDVGERGENIIYWKHDISDNSNCDPGKRGRPRHLQPIDEYLLTLTRLRLGLFVEDLAYRFGISNATVCRINITLVNLMYLKLGVLNIWPSQEIVRRSSPNTFKEK